MEPKSFFSGRADKKTSQRAREIAISLRLPAFPDIIITRPFRGNYAFFVCAADDDEGNNKKQHVWRNYRKIQLPKTETPMTSGFLAIDSLTNGHYFVECFRAPILHAY